MAEKKAKKEEAKTEEKSQTALDVFIDHQKNAAVQAGKALEGLVPTAIRDHGSSAFQEMVEGYRQLFNAAIDEVVERIEKVKVKEDSKK